MKYDDLGALRNSKHHVHITPNSNLKFHMGPLICYSALTMLQCSTNASQTRLSSAVVFVEVMAAKLRAQMLTGRAVCRNGKHKASVFPRRRNTLLP